MEGVEEPDLPVSPEEYAKRRAKYRKTGEREEGDESAGPVNQSTG